MIESARIAIETHKRDGVATRVTPPPLCAGICSMNPPGIYYDRVLQEVVDPTPSVEGQLIFCYDSTLKGYLLYVSVDTGTSILWKKTARISKAIDPRTGRPYDSNASFYNPLAT